ncbi:MAG: Sec-independent protein translocase protein TatB [Arcobacteraceae bacterium]|jgi:sec-independent protein translocase protein TatB|nr:Sec-independent protein translocase protein TatB [Arcobacteraceae bacterium]
MFGFGLMEILLIAIVAIIALGPEKLPSAMVDIAKFFRKIKSGLEDAKSTLDNELKISELKSEAEKYKAQVENLKASANIENILADDYKASTKEVTSDIKTNDATAEPKQQEPVRHKVSFSNNKDNTKSENE